MTGPGQTRFLVNDDKSISSQRWNDPSWRTVFMSQFDLSNPHVIASALRRAYVMGYNDRLKAQQHANAEIKA